MYKIELINGDVVDILHHPHKNFNKVIDATIDECINTVSQSSILIPATTKADINLFKTIVKITDMEKRKDVFLGRVIKVSEEMSNDGTFTKRIDCESLLGVLNDTYIREYIKETTASSLLSHYLSKAIVYNDYIFKAGTVEDVEDKVKIEINYETVLSSLLNLADIINRKVNVRIEDKTIYIDLLKNLSNKQTQRVQMGVNMMSIVKELDASDFATRIIPLASDEEGNKLTIKKVNGNKDYIQDDELVSQYGVIEMVCEDTGTIKDAKTLLSWAKSQLSFYKSIKLVLDCSAIDLSYLSGKNLERIELDDAILITNNVLNINVVVRVVSKSYSIYEAYNPQLSLSSRRYTATDTILDIRNRQRIRNKVSTLNTQTVNFEDNITTTKALLTQFNISSTDYIDAYLNIETLKYRYYTENGESYTTYPDNLKIYINDALIHSIDDCEEIIETVNLTDYLKEGLNILKITSERNGRLRGGINIKTRS